MSLAGRGDVGNMLTKTVRKVVPHWGWGWRAPCLLMRGLSHISLEGLSIPAPETGIFPLTCGLGPDASGNGMTKAPIADSSLCV